jgi:hypothetical protein
MACTVSIVDPTLAPTEISTPETTQSPVIETAIPTPSSVPVEAIPSSEALYFHAPDSGSVWRLALNQSQLERVTPEGRQVTSFDIWPGDGRQAYGTKDGQVIVALPGQDPQILYNADEWADYSPYVRDIAWSPDGARLAFSVLAAEYLDSSHADNISQFDGIWLLTLEGELARLAGNAYCYHDKIIDNEEYINECQVLTEPTWSPDGTALLLTAFHWEWIEFLVLAPAAPGATMSHPYDPENEGWARASWTRDGQAILFSGIQYSSFSPLVRIELDTMNSEILVDDNMDLYIHDAFELPSGDIAFMATSIHPIHHSAPTLYIGQRIEDGFFNISFSIEQAWCKTPMNVIWNSTGQMVVLACQEDIKLFSLDNNATQDLGPFLGSLVEEDDLQIIWGPS